MGKNTRLTKSLKWFAMASTAAVAVSAGAAFAQDEEEDVITIKGELRESLEESLAVKKNNEVVSDALVGVEIGDLPDLSIAETLERITGVTSDRFKGGASELSVRGLGAFLGSSVINGREISSGSDGRDVNFGQFPSELIGGAVVYKSQQASFVEGGISGIIELQTLRPLDYGKRRFQVQGLLGYSDYEQRVDEGQDFSKRITASYTDQFETGIGDIGIALGGQIRDDTAPEDIYTSSSTYRPCNTIEGVDNSNNCNFNPDGGASDTYFVSNQYIYRAMQTEADRDAIMANIQWQPNAQWDINFDAQWSDRSDLEKRGNLVIADGRRDIVPLDISESGALNAWTTETRIENQSVWRVRDESYTGFGLNAEWSGDNLVLTGDIGYSKTERRQDELDMRIRTNDRVIAQLDSRGENLPTLTFLDVSEVEDDTGLTFDLNNHDMYDNGARARRRLENIDDEIFAVRFDGEYFLEGNFFTSLEAGVRIATRERFHDDGIDDQVDLVDGDYASAGAIAARRDTFIVEDLFEGADTPMEGITWATWNPEELFIALTGSRDAGLPTGSTLSPDDTDVKEDTFAVYAQGNFETEMFSLPAYGNIGLRAIKTEIESVGISSALATSPGDDPDTVIVEPVGDPITNVEENDFWSILPSANLTLEMSETQLLRFAAYRAIARPDMEAMSAALSFDDSADLDSIEAIVSASGNPFLEPLESTNFDVSYEWYFDDDTAFSAAFYAKQLETGIETVQETVVLNVDGTQTPVLIGRSGNSDESSTLMGIELSFQHVFDELPSPFDGFGIRAGHNYADSDFEFPDPTIPDGTNALADFTKPANIPGYSQNTTNLAVFWEKYGTSVRLAYKARSSYFKPFRSAANRYTEAQDFLDFSASYDITDDIEIRFQGLNLLDEPNIFYRPTRDSLAQADYSGRRFFVGLRGKF